MSTVRLYDPNNEPFDVPETRVSKLVLEHGWTQTPYEVVDTPAAVEQVREELHAEAPLEAEDEPADEADEPGDLSMAVSKRKG